MKKTTSKSLWTLADYRTQPDSTIGETTYMSGIHSGLHQRHVADEQKNASCPADAARRANSTVVVSGNARAQSGIILPANRVSLPRLHAITVTGLISSTTPHALPDRRTVKETQTPQPAPGYTAHQETAAALVAVGCLGIPHRQPASGDRPALDTAPHLGRDAGSQPE